MIDHFEGFVPIHTVFYSIFHPTEGTKVRYEFPPGNLQTYNINFDTIKNYIIPKPQLCHKLLTLKYGDYRLVSYPVTINSSLYARNFFSFNFVFVFPINCETSPYEPIIARLGKMFRVLEEQNQLLSRAENDSVYFDNSHSLLSSEQDSIMHQDKNTSILGFSRKRFSFSKRPTDLSLSEYPDNESGSNFSVQDLIMRIFQDLNNYSECLIPIDEGNSVDIKIFPSMVPPSISISYEDVPVAMVDLSHVMDVNWDPTMLKIVPFIDSINSISRIAALSNSDVDFVVECIRHLVYYQLVILSDIFQFTNIYAPTSRLRDFLTDINLATDCQTYVCLPKNSNFGKLPLEKSINTDLDEYSNSGSAIYPNNEILENDDRLRWPMYYKPRNSQSSLSSGISSGNERTSNYLPTKSCLFDLYRSLSQGTVLHDWYNEHYSLIHFNKIDIRRFITFGLVRGLLYRCYAIPIMKNAGIFDILSSLTTSQSSNPYHSNGDDKNGTASTANIRFLNSITDSDIHDLKDDEINNSGSCGIKPSFDVNKLFINGDDHSETTTVKHNSSRDASEHLFSPPPKRQILNSGIADKVLSDIHRKLAKFDDTPRSPIVKRKEDTFRDFSNGSNIVGYGSSNTGNKVSFNLSRDSDTTQNNLDHMNPILDSSKDIIAQQQEKNHIRRLLLESLREADNMDKICIKLQKPRKEVEELLSEIGDYVIINC
ncbi:hypothetical protein TBLA_0G01010 [Henningerozyma blattae CBS 6284]|uniref:Nitrogen permease regulator 2 n=1 Tax=Henningerozyma blattae (strain ATCC 34711 / CBS 6284 / DSM 70876 / NBRC 10599 / NRRL Y-10934 / UCD 77-7) TaxID=1071380 RepID=I2H6P6_HENB6|nr:hypothetical protein TBLA_0G01010 [Tetrapisispora blattae CBS 6284]CCH62048.1 hypothetical protein TBLA_0G01010 [Tetrapisispora blattae CBS 6284]